MMFWLPIAYSLLYKKNTRQVDLPMQAFAMPMTTLKLDFPSCFLNLLDAD
jgi:hypothetical protein